jgi:hypothetical protein
MLNGTMDELDDRMSLRIPQSKDGLPMSKFYVMNGFQAVRSRSSARDAAKDFLLERILSGAKLTEFKRSTSVNETGFNRRRGVKFSTVELLKEVGVL